MVCGVCVGYIGLVVSDDLFMFSPPEAYIKHVVPCIRLFMAPGHNLNILGKGPLNVATSTFFSLCDPDMQRTETI